MSDLDDDDPIERQLRTTSLQNIPGLLHARQRAERELSRTRESLEEETRILELLNETGAVLASNLDLEELVQTITDAGTFMTGAQLGAFFYQSPTDQSVFTLYTLSGVAREAFAPLGPPRTTPIFAPTFAGEGVIRLDDVTEDPRYGQLGPFHGLPPGHPPVRSYLAMSVVSRSGEVIGGLLFGHGEPGVFTARSERLLIGLAAQASIAIDNARLYEAATRVADERAELLARERGVRAQIERVSLMKDEFLSTLSHELRTPLNAILGWTELLLSRVGEPDTRRGLDTIARNARAQAQLIDDLLDMSRIVSGKLRLDVQRLELAAIVEAAIESVRPSADAKAIVIRQTIDPYGGTQFGDPNRLQQVVWNLLTNAVKFTPQAGKIDVLVHRVSSHLEIVIHDTGAGISAEFLPSVFERFRQADASTTRSHGGLGLGLSIVRQLVELHGGTVEAESAGEGEGATFTVRLPLRAVRDTPAYLVEHPATPPPPSREPDGSLAGLRVLVVDDEPDARELVKAVLTDCGAEVDTAGSAVDGLASVQLHNPDVIVSDIGMPGRDGYQFMRDVRALASDSGQVPAIALTAFARSEDRTRAMLAGYQAHIAKPIEPQELIATIKSVAASASRRR